jgi:hypothetical protein
MEHKNQYENEKLEEIFHPAIYYFEKVTEAILGNTPKEFGKGLVEVLASVPQKFRMALETRGIFQAYNLEDDFEWVEYAISKIKQYFDDSSELKLNEKDAYIYLSFLKTQIKQLEQTAKEIDDDYVSVDN